MPPSKSSEKVTDPLIPILKSQVIPCWECFGKDRLAVTAKTLKQFNDASPPALMRTSVKKRIGKKTKARGDRGYYKLGSYLYFWPEDNLAVFRYPTLAFVLDGQADFQVGDYVIECPQNHFLLFASGVPRPIGSHPHFEEENVGQRKCSVLWFFAPPGTSSVIFYVCHSEGERHFSDRYCIVRYPAIFHLYQLLIEELERHEPRHKEVGPQLLDAFLHLLLSELQQGHFHHEGHSSNSTFLEKSASSIEEAQQYISTHLNLSLTANHVAGQVYMSRSNFLQHFKRDTGETFLEFVIGQRMEEARRLLSEGHWAISYVSSRIGLRPAQFRVQFKKHFGVSPMEFREKSSKKRRNQ